MGEVVYSTRGWESEGVKVYACRCLSLAPPGGDGVRDLVGGFESLEPPVLGDHLLRIAAAAAVVSRVAGGGGGGWLGERDRSKRVEQGEEGGGVGCALGVVRVRVRVLGSGGGSVSEDATAGGGEGALGQFRAYHGDRPCRGARSTRKRDWRDR